MALLLLLHVAMIGTGPADMQALVLLLTWAQKQQYGVAAQIYQRCSPFMRSLAGCHLFQRCLMQHLHGVFQFQVHSCLCAIW